MVYNGLCLSPTQESLINLLYLQVMDSYLRDRAKESGATVKNGLFLRSSQDGTDGPFTLTYSNYEEGGKVRYSLLVFLAPLSYSKECAFV